MESLVGFTLDKLSNFEARLEAIENRGPPKAFPIFGLGTPAGVSTPKAAFHAPKSLEDIQDPDLREALKAIQTPAHDRKELLTDPQLRYVQWFRKTRGPVTGMVFIFHSFHSVSSSLVKIALSLR